MTERIASQASIHVHFYDAANMQVLLDHAVREAGYGDFTIMHTPNHKDFYFVLEK